MQKLSGLALVVALYIVGCARSPAEPLTIGAFFSKYCGSEALVCKAPTGPVTLRGKMIGKAGICTKQACSEDRPCCNTCSGNPALTQS